MIIKNKNTKKPHIAMLSNDEIYQRIQIAIMERQLLPGAKLAEEPLVEATGASRSRIRQILARLAHEQIVTLVPNRGAFIAKPTVEDARELFLTRRLIEPGLVSLLAEHATALQVETLREHVNQEKIARAQNDQRRIIRLSGEFHMQIANMVANNLLVRIMRELVALTCLIITLYDKPNTPACDHFEHNELVDFIAAKNKKAAKAHMLEHLQHIEHTLDLSGSETDEPDFEAIFA